MKNRDTKYNWSSSSFETTHRASNRLLTGAVMSAFVFFAQPASAQDTASPFAGFYAGAHAGYSWSDATFNSDPYNTTLPPNQFVSISGRSDNFDLDGGLFGFHTGYNVVTRKNILFGIEGDLTHLGNKDTVTGSQVVAGTDDDINLDHRSTLELAWQGTLRGRLGYVSGRTLFFGTAGVALLKTNWDETATAFDVDTGTSSIQTHSDNETLTGLVLGGGVEYAVSRNVILGADYLYENFGGYGSVPFGHSDPAEQGRIGDLDVHKVRVRLSIKLGGDGE